MRGFLDMECDERTDERTDERESIGLSGWSRETKNEISTVKLLRVQIFSKIQQLLKNHYLKGGIFNIFGGARIF